MNLIKLTALFLVLFFGSLQARSHTAEFVAYLIKHLSQSRETGVPNVVFYGLSPKYPLDGVLGEIVRDPTLDHVAKLVFTRDLMLATNESVPYKPTLLILEGEITTFVGGCKKILRAFSPYTRVVVLTEYITMEWAKYGDLLATLQFYHVYFFDVVQHVRIRISVLDTLFERNLVGPDHYRNLEGEPIQVLKDNSLAFTSFFRNWFSETAKLMNTTFVNYPHNCPDGRTNLCYMQVLFQGKVDVDSYIYHMPRFSRTLSLLITPMVEYVVIAVPQSQLTIVQRFTYCLDYEVWIILGALVATVELIHLLYPSVIKNDPFLLVVCGFERRDLNKAKSLEIYLLHSMMILMFFVTSAYETILISWMTNPPLSARPRTLLELADSGIKIKSDPRYNNYTGHDILGGSVINGTENFLKFDGINAYLIGRDYASCNLYLHYDPVQKLNRYSILEEPFEFFIQSYLFSYRSPLMEGFARSLAIFVEAGITQFWEAPELWSTEMSKIRIVKTGDGNLSFVDLSPIWNAVLLGWVLGFMVFLLEITAHKVIAICLKLGKK